MNRLFRRHSPGQLWFDAIPESPQLHRLFLALLPDATTAAALERLAHALRHKHGLHCWPLPTAHFHVSLHGLCDDMDLRRDMIEIARAAAAKISIAPFALTFDRAMSFRRNQETQPFVLRESGGHAPLHQLYRDLGAALLQAGLRHPSAPRFTPHLTLLYDPRIIGEQKIEPVSWTVTEFALIHSLLGRTQYRILDRWPLPR
jgi:2'-5' RNA ligase